MRTLLLTTGLGARNGWTRYAQGFADGLRARGTTIDVATETLLHSRPDTLLKLPRIAIDALRLWSLARQADVIHAMIEPYAPLACVLGWLARRPVAISVHGSYGDRASYPSFIRPLYDWAFSRALALPVSRYTAEVVKKSFLPRTLAIVPGGVLLDDGFVPRTMPSGTPRLLAVGELKPRKGFHTLIEAVARLRDSGRNLECDIVGATLDETYASRLRALIADRGLGAAVRLRGRVEDAALRDLYRNAALFVLPVEHDGPTFEGLGLVYLEAMAAGTPAIGSRDCGAEDIIRDGENGFLVPPRDAEATAEAIQRALTEPSAWSRLSAAARETAEGFRWDRCVEKMERAYETLTR